MLEQALDAKGKEVRLQVLQVSLQYRTDRGDHQVYTFVKDRVHDVFSRILRWTPVDTPCAKSSTIIILPRSVDLHSSS